ncbi:MAG: HNH endonuclease [Micropruina sp.]|nr:HNH endonuclease [Micropruina sp.]
MTDVIVFNAGGHQVLHRVTLQHAIRMLYRNVARVREAVPGERFGPYPRPRSLELINYVYTRWVYHSTGRLPCTLSNVLRRDRFRCAYCGGPADTRDHIVPRSRGGASSWLNLVAACATCNGRKRDRTPAQAGMPLLVRPFVPSASQLSHQRG